MSVDPSVGPGIVVQNETQRMGAEYVSYLVSINNQHASGSSFLMQNDRLNSTCAMCRVQVIVFGPGW